MEMEKYWHPHFNWYGPSGIGSSRGIESFRNWHQTPFLDAMPDRGQHPDDVSKHFFAEGAYVALTGWPNMAQTLSGQGWLGIAPTGQKITLRSLDFWRLENGFIRENWVLVDLLDVWKKFFFLTRLSFEISFFDLSKKTLFNILSTLPSNGI